MLSFKNSPNRDLKVLFLGLALAWTASYTVAQEASVSAEEACIGYGPQTPRDIDSLAGTNALKSSLAPAYQELNLCNIHFHNNAEHRAESFAIYAGVGDKGKGGGYQCAISKTLTDAELAVPEGEMCKGLKPGDTIEVHWVHTNCDVAPGPGLGSCLSDKCANPDLRVETQVFTLVNDENAMNFDDFSYQGNQVEGRHQALALPADTGLPVEFIGSTTGPNYTDAACSPIHASWSVRPSCAKLDINSLGRWCESNVFEEDSAHGVRALITNPALLSEIKK